SGAAIAGTVSFATYDAAVGVRPLTASEYAPTITSGATDLNNASLNSTVNLTAPTTINSLRGGTVTGNTTLTIDSGLVSAATLSVSTVTFNHPAVIFGGTINSVITGSSVLIDGATTFAASNQYTGPTIIGFNTL